jgi:ribosomal protein S12 methylthiotransferase accessory factor
MMSTVATTRSTPPWDRDRILGLWDLLVDPRVGIVREVRELPVDDDEPDFFHYLSTACDTTAFGALKNFANNGGVSTTRRRAIGKAMGEAVERYCAAQFDEEALEYAAFDELDRRATRPESYALYRAEEYAAPGFPWKPFRRDTRVAWTPGRSLVSGEEVLVPAAAVFVPYHYRHARGDAAIMQPISTGLACGPSRAAATLSALCEAIERDAFTITWQAGLSRPRVARDGVPTEADVLLRRYESCGLRVEIVDIATDIACPTLLTVAIGSAPTSPALAVAAAADPSPLRALLKSLEELAHTRKYAAQLMDLTPPVSLDVAAGHPAVQTQREHLRVYCPQESIPFASFLWASDEVRPLAEPAVSPGPLAGAPVTGADQAQLDAIVASVVAAGLEPVACDLTTADVADLGLAVMRVVIPGLHPLFMGHQNRALGGRRLAEMPAILGGSGLASAEGDNPYPHPFP